MCLFRKLEEKFLKLQVFCPSCLSCVGNRGSTMAGCSFTWMGRENSIDETLVSSCFASVMDPNSVAERRIEKERVRWLLYLQDDLGSSGVMAFMSMLPFWALVLCLFSEFLFSLKAQLTTVFWHMQALGWHSQQSRYLQRAFVRECFPKRWYLDFVLLFTLAVSET